MTFASKFLVSSNNQQVQQSYKILRSPRFVACLIIFGLATLAMIPAFIRGLPSDSDAVLHYRWATGFIETLKEGSLYPRWLAEPNHGQGSPTMVYYPPLQFYVIAFFYLLTGNVLKSLLLGCWLALSLSGLTMYLFTRSSLSHKASLFAAAIYMLAPYHLLDLYERAALTEFWSFVWVPLIFYAIGRVARLPGWKAVPLLSLAYALLLLTNTPISFAVTLILPIYALFITRRLTGLGKITAGLVLGLGLSAIFIVPIIFEHQYVRLKRLDYRDKYKEHFLIENIPQTLRGEAVESNIKPKPIYEKPYYLLMESNAVLTMLLLAAASFLLWKERISNQLNSSLYALAPAVWAVTCLSLLLTTRLSYPLWRLIPGMPYLQFPFRWLVIGSWGIAFLSVACLPSLSEIKRRRFISAWAIALALGLNLAITMLIVLKHPGETAAVVKGVAHLDAPEYRPQWWDWNADRETNLAPVEVQSGDATLSALDEKGSRQSYRVAASAQTILKFRTLYFPGWVGRVDGKPVEVGPGDAGNILLTVEPGDHTVTLSFEDTRPRIAGSIISAISLTVILIITFFTHRKLDSPAESIAAGE